MDYNSGISYAKEEGKKVIIKKRLDKKMPLETIMEITGLSKEELEKIK